MIISSCFVAIVTALASIIALWPSIGPMSLLATPFFSSAAVLVMAAFLEARAALRSSQHREASHQQAAAV
jgi:hypothetical protein